ncbi:MAG: CDP-diacylglycerol--glycerol-3-phosphate 3-phosphatidyltransferase [Clostridia bacterium]|nr:CDP-diacylglycerol--glycerol-3-phosphate 3-phosphatidyltransferase [Clostridia bacterium]
MSCPKNLPNVLTVIRAVLVPVFMVLVIFPILPGETVTRLVGAALFGVISFTDMLDGHLARKYNIVTDFGKFLDPLADKLLVLGAMLSLVLFNGMKVGDYAFAVACTFATFIVLLREFAVTSLRLLAKKSDGKVIAANMAGKVKTVSQIVFVIAAMLEPLLVGYYPADLHFLFITYTSLAVMVYMTVYSGIKYFMIYLPMIKSE